MKLTIITAHPELANDLADVCRIFYGQMEWETKAPAPQAPAPQPGEIQIFHQEELREDETAEQVTVLGEAKGMAERVYSPQRDPLSEKRLRKRAAKLAAYDVLKRSSGVTPPWGALTGIRPTRLLYAQMESGLSVDEAARQVQSIFDVSDKKMSLLQEIVLTQQTLPPPDPSRVEIYVGIPFCMSRCAYCSFLSGEVGDGRLLAPYTDALLREIGFVRELIREKGLKVSTVYVGGGTPTALTEELLARVLGALRPLALGREWTVEAGRPDTITKEKLSLIRDAGATRISVNPQTAHDVTLQRIGRAHTVRQTEEAYALAREMGFDDINMDLIAGLPGEDLPMFRETLRWAERMNPDSLTVHTLSIKHASVLHLFGAPLPDGDMVAVMQDEGRAAARKMGMRAYYLYRQKYMAGSLENVAYARPGRECLYNVRMMEETGHVLALGAGGISKRLWPEGGRISRATNVGSIEDYIMRVEEMCGRKKKLWEIATCQEDEKTVQ